MIEPELKGNQEVTSG